MSDQNDQKSTISPLTIASALRSPEGKIWPPDVTIEVLALEKENTKIIFDAFDRAGIDIRSDDDKRNILHRSSIEVWLAYGHGIDPLTQAQEPNSRVAIQDFIKRTDEFTRSLVALLQEGSRSHRPGISLNMADIFVQRLRAEFSDVGAVLEDLDNTLYEIKLAASSALDIGHPNAGMRNMPYADFAKFIRQIWDAKRSGDRGAYRSDGTFRGPFVNLIADCEMALPEPIRSKSATARGDMLGRLFQWKSRSKRARG